MRSPAWPGHTGDLSAAKLAIQQQQARVVTDQVIGSQRVNCRRIDASQKTAHHRLLPANDAKLTGHDIYRPVKPSLCLTHLLSSAIPVSEA